MTSAACRRFYQQLTVTVARAANYQLTQFSSSSSNSKPNTLRILQSTTNTHHQLVRHQQQSSSSSNNMSPPAMSQLEGAKKNAAFEAVDKWVKTDTVVGVGSGSTVVYVVQSLRERVDREKLSIVCVPTSFQSRQLIIQHGLQLGELDRYPELDVCIDGADEVDAQLNLIKGGGGCLLQEKIVAACAKTLIVVADFTKDSTTLGTQWLKGVPIEVAPIAYVPIQRRIEARLGGEAKLRMAISKAGPCVTDNGNFILDWKNFAADSDWPRVNAELLQMPGIVETGLFLGMAEQAYFGMKDGTVTSRNRV